MNVLPTSYPDIKLPEGASTGQPPAEQPSLTVPELRHLCDLLIWADKVGHWDQKTDSWTYPTEIRAKLARMLAAMEGQAQ